MLIVPLLFVLIRILRVVLLQAPDGHPTLAIRGTQGHFGQRRVNDIIISCFTTTFACIWSAIHPNVPAPTDSWWTCFKRQVVTMIYAFLAPELITIWALRQHLAARRIMNEYNMKRSELIDPSERSSILDAIRALFRNQSSPGPFQKDRAERWTLTHAFFLQMGGFVLCEDGRPIQTLIDAGGRRRDRPGSEDSTTLIWNIDNGMIDPPRISAEDINDRSKGDAISKAFVILQTSWFIAQCVARWATRLPVTELEVATLAFATLNGITYGLWWDKPQNVGRPVFLECKQPREVLALPHGGDSTAPRHAKRSRLRSKLREDIEEFTLSAPWIILGRAPMRLLEAMISPMTSLAGNTPSAVRNSDLRVAMFYAAFTDTENKTVIAYTAIGVLFGLVHLVPSWYLEFPSRPEMWLWRAAAIIITTGPIFSSVTLYFARKVRDPRIFFHPLWIGVPLYVVSRSILLILPLISLHSLHSDALQTIKWTTFIPHL
ncbi:hypothetical protein BJ912DRAFT_998707 [Pholiota molesta]|nr:hypothetical protein BJ912DRAFT_998707 [Pholiota molesta]